MKRFRVKRGRSSHAYKMTGRLACMQEACMGTSYHLSHSGVYMHGLFRELNPGPLAP